MRSFLLAAAVCVCVLLRPLPAPGQPADGIDRLVVAIETAARQGDEAALRGLTRRDAPTATLAEFVANLTGERLTNATVKERDRAPIPGGRQRILLEVLAERGRQGRVSTWRLDVSPPVGTAGPDTPWQIAQIEKLTVVSGLYRLELDSTTEFEVHNLTMIEPDFRLTMASGHAFVARAQDGPTALVLIGRTHVSFTPPAAAERGQLRIFNGSESFTADVDQLFVRFSPDTYAAQVQDGMMTPRPVDQGHLRKATQIFTAEAPLSFQIDLGDLSVERWSLVPTSADFIAEIPTRRNGTLTYARASSEPEDISFFDRRRKRNISIYASEEKLAAHGRFFSEDDQADYDVTHYDIRTAFSPDRLWMDGASRITLHTRKVLSGTMTLRLADPLVVRSVSSPVFGRLLHLRVVGQNSVLIGFPATVPADTDVDLDLVYGGRLQPQSLEREAVAVQQDQLQSEQIVIPPEPQWVYSNRSYWYPQGTTTDYATASIAVVVPAEFAVVASGVKQREADVAPAAAGQRPRKQFTFEATSPARYLSVIVSRFTETPPTALTLRGGDGTFDLQVAANPRIGNKMKGFADRTTDILGFYAALLGDTPYDSFTVTLAESDLPGGHSPPYFAIINQPLPTSPFSWQNDPVAFQNYPSFFLAHEVAHQWWGQAVGWKNYHEQWISEGFAQYFAALYAQRERGPDGFASVLRQMRRTAMDSSSNGPVYLGYRLGHLKGDSRVFRALVYNKGAMVLHMLRRLMGDEAFYKGLREFYATWRFKKAGTDDFRTAMAAASGLPLERFFDRWIFGSSLPAIRFSSSTSSDGLHVTFDQTSDEIFDVPVTVTLSYADGTSADVIVPVTDKHVERTIPLKGELRSVDVNRDSGALADIDR